MMLDTILVPLDGSELARRALLDAMALARVTQARIVLMRAIPPRRPGSATDEKEAIEEELGAAGDDLRADGITIKTVVHRIFMPDVARAICAAANDEQAGLIIMSTHGRGGPGRWVYGSVADSVLQQTDTPVMLVPLRSDHSWPTDRRPRVLIPLDGSGLAEEALRAAERLAEPLDASLDLLRVVEPPAYPLYGEAYAYIPYDEEAELSAARMYLQQHVERLQSAGRSASMRVLVGHPAALVAEAARSSGADCIVMATHGRSGLARLMLGSVATGTIQRATLPILLVRPGMVAFTDQGSPSTTNAGLGEPIAAR